MFPTRTLIQAFARIPEDGHGKGSRPHIFEDFDVAVLSAPTESKAPVAAFEAPALTRVLMTPNGRAAPR